MRCQIDGIDVTSVSSVKFVYFVFDWALKFSSFFKLFGCRYEMDVEENYVILKAKKAKETDPYAAKAWILTAKSLYANNFGVQVNLFCRDRKTHVIENI